MPALVLIGILSWVAPGCAGKRPATEAPRALAAGASLAEVLAAISAPVPPGHHRTVSRLEVWVTRDEPWTRTRAEDAAAGDDLAVLAESWCRREFDGHLWRGHVVSWYLLAGGALDAMDDRAFGQRCAVRSRYLPAASARVALEREAAARAARVQSDPLPAFTLYERALSLVDVDRIADAEALLARADALAPEATGSFARQRLLRALDAARGSAR